MPRTKFDFHDDRVDAAAALSALREVGLNPGDVGGAWRADEPKSGGVGGQDAPLITSQILEVDGIGQVEVSGWIADRAREISGTASLLTLQDLLQHDVPDADELERIRKTLLAGGGIVGVRARETFSDEPD